MSEKRDEFLKSLKPNKGNEEDKNYADFVFAKLNESARDREEVAALKKKQEERNYADFVFAKLNESAREKEAIAKKEIEATK